MAQHTMTFEVENGITKAKIDGVYMGGGKAAKVEADENQIKDVVEDTVKVNPELSGTEPNLEGLQVGEDKYANPEGTTVIANPALAGIEDNLTGIEIGNTKYNVSNVEANPTLDGTESDLLSIDIDGTKYKVPQGGSGNVQQLYKSGIKYVLLSDRTKKYIVSSVIKGDLLDIDWSEYFDKMDELTSLYIEVAGFGDIVISEDENDTLRLFGFVGADSYLHSIDGTETIQFDNEHLEVYDIYGGTPIFPEASGQQE